MHRMFVQQSLERFSNELMKPEVRSTVFGLGPDQCQAPTQAAPEPRRNQGEQTQRRFVAEHDVIGPRRDPARPSHPVFLTDMPHLAKVKGCSGQVLNA